jgi:ADP-ribosyl-[dinitrogen reductase] hydrolase
MVQKLSLRERFRGIILGTAVGDALGLPAEGISRRRAMKLFKGPWRHRLVIDRGMVSDDTDHAVFVAQSLLAHPNSSELFVRRISWCLRWWLLSLPAGIGLATLKSILRLWVGFSPFRSGVYSAGNAPAMRAAPIGAFFAYTSALLDDYLQAATLITHTDPRALIGAKAVSYLTAWSIREDLTERPSLEGFSNILRSAGKEDEDWGNLVGLISTAYRQRHSVHQFAETLGLSNGITGYVYHTVPVAVYAWYNHFGLFEQALSAVLSCGGDTDTSGAITGALTGAVTGESGIPSDWLEGIFDWPRGPKLLRKIADELAEKSQRPAPSTPVRYFWPGLVLRNAFLLSVVLLHGLRRLAPPY